MKSEVVEKNENDVQILARIIHEQNALGAVLPEGFNDMRCTWDDSGRLIKLDLQDCRLSGTLDVSGLDALEVLLCQNNALAALNVSGCESLRYLVCVNNKIKVLDLKDVPQLKNLVYDSGVEVLT